MLNTVAMGCVAVYYVMQSRTGDAPSVTRNKSLEASKVGIDEEKATVYQDPGASENRSVHSERQ